MCDIKRWLFGWLVCCFGFNGPLRQYFSLYRADILNVLMMETADISPIYDLLDIANIFTDYCQWTPLPSGEHDGL